MRVLFLIINLLLLGYIALLLFIAKAYGLTEVPWVFKALALCIICAMNAAYISMNRTQKIVTVGAGMTSFLTIFALNADKLEVSSSLSAGLTTLVYGLVWYSSIPNRRLSQKQSGPLISNHFDY